MNVSGIYKIESLCKPERVYIGSAMNIKLRRNGHLSKLRSGKHGNNKLQGHFNKYGEADLVFNIIESCAIDNLLDREQFFINELTPSFNICKTAGSVRGRKHSEISKQKIKDGHKGQVPWNKDKKATEEARLNQSNSHIGKTPWNKGKTGIYSEDTLQKLRGNKNCLNRKLSKTSLEKMRKPKSEVAKHNMRLAWEKRKSKQSA